jgi:catechol 2,3-dioxygenase-like lactoylglutathione lyase family enzyme
MQDGTQLVLDLECLLDVAGQGRADQGEDWPQVEVVGEGRHGQAVAAAHAAEGDDPARAAPQHVTEQELELARVAAAEDDRWFGRRV